uniref:Uncharacterized protein n=1 Tax=Knipowitschia caucasica TaxID=637954 RepID=A0AAV2MA92_KNICA
MIHHRDPSAHTGHTHGTDPRSSLRHPGFISRTEHTEGARVKRGQNALRRSHRDVQIHKISFEVSEPLAIALKVFFQKPLTVSLQEASLQFSVQNSRESRGFQRGFRRPYNFRGRGRGRGYFQRGRYQRGGGGYNNNNNNNNNNNRHNWKNYKKQPKYSQGQFHNGPGHSRSPPQGQNHHSEPSCSPQPRLSSSPKSTVNRNPKHEPEELSGHNPEERDTKGEEYMMETNKASDEKNQGTWIPLTEVSSPRRESPPSSSGATSAPTPQTTANGKSNGALCWKNVCKAPLTKKTSPESLNPMLSSFDIFSSEEFLDGDKAALSAAFRKFLEEQSKKAKALHKGTDRAGDEESKVNGTASPARSGSGCGHEKDVSDEKHINGIRNTFAFRAGNGGNDDKMIKSQTGSFLSEKGLREKPTSSGQTSAESKRPSAASGSAVEDLCSRQNQESCKARKMSKRSPVPLNVMSQKRGRDLSTDEDFKVLPTKKEATFDVSLDFPADNLLSSSDIIAKERQLSQDLVQSQSSKKDSEFHSIFQHVQAAQVQRSSSERFAQHIVTIVHHIKAQHFTSSGLTLNERFTMYQKQAAEKETVKSRKSPEIHRRLEVSPSAFRKHSQIFEAIKRAEEATYKEPEEPSKADPLDLRGDIEQRKSHCSHDTSVASAERHDPSAGKTPVVFSKFIKNKNVRSRSSSSSSSSSSSEEEEKRDKKSPVKSEQGLNRVKLDTNESVCDRGRSYEAFHIQIRGRSWSRGTSRCSSTNANNEDWDPEFTPKSNKYFLHDDRDGAAESRWADATSARGRGRMNGSRGRARFIIRRANGNYSASNWNNREQAGAEQDHRGSTERK